MRIFLTSSPFYYRILATRNFIFFYKHPAHHNCHISDFFFFNRVTRSCFAASSPCSLILHLAYPNVLVMLTEHISSLPVVSRDCMRLIIKVACWSASLGSLCGEYFFLSLFNELTAYQLNFNMFAIKHLYRVDLQYFLSLHRKKPLHGLQISNLADWLNWALAKVSFKVGMNRNLQSTLVEPGQSSKVWSLNYTQTAFNVLHLRWNFL